MIPASFDYERASSVDEAIRLLEEGGEEAKLLAGGHSLLPLMRLRMARPTLLVDVGRIDELSYVREDGDRIAIGALTRHHDVNTSDVLRDGCGIVAHTAGLVGDPQVRHRGTIGGSVAHGDPASDLPTVLLALDAELVSKGPDGEKTTPASAFFTSLFETALGPRDVLTEIRVPKLGPDHGWAYQKFRRRAQDWAVVGAAAVVERSNGSVGSARIGLTNMGMTPLRASAAEEALAGASGDAIARGAEQAAEGTSPPGDTNASSEFRQHLARVLTRRAVEESLAR